MNISIQYSPLCDTDSAAYSRYLDTLRGVFSNVPKDAFYFEGLRDAQFVCSLGVDAATVGDAEGVGIRDRGDASSRSLLEDLYFARYGGLFSRYTGASAQRLGHCRNVGAVGQNGENIRVFDDDDSVVEPERSRDTGCADAPGVNGLENNDSVESLRVVNGAFGSTIDDIHHKIGPNHARNVLNRKEKKKRKAAKRAIQLNRSSARCDGCLKNSNRAVGEGSDSRVELNVDNNDKNNSSDEKKEFDYGRKKDDLRLSLERKWAAENELAALKAERQLAVLKANAIDAEVKKYRTAVCVATERNMVAIEKVHGQLKANGDISVDDDSRVQTILSGSSGESAPLVSGVVSGTISPNSSASMAEFRAVQKKLLDLEDKNARMTLAFEKMGLSLEAFEAKDKSVWTDTPENHVLLDQLYPEGYGMSFDYTPDGKFTVC